MAPSMNCSIGKTIRQLAQEKFLPLTHREEKKVAALHLVAAGRW
jgi:hypothetical protein